jgi:hypothetical protein
MVLKWTLQVLKRMFDGIKSHKKQIIETNIYVLVLRLKVLMWLISTKSSYSIFKNQNLISHSLRSKNIMQSCFDFFNESHYILLMTLVSLKRKNNMLNYSLKLLWYAKKKKNQFPLHLAWTLSPMFKSLKKK